MTGAAPFERHPTGPSDLLGLSTLRDLLRHAVSRFGAAGLAFGHGCANVHDEAAALVLWALHLPPERLEPYLEARLSPDEIASIGRLIELRVATRRPLPYLTGEAWLGGLRFACDDRALVPRSPIVEAMDGALADWLRTIDPPADWPRTIADVCTGGGSLAIHAALRFPQARVLALDIDPRALSLCAENLALHGVEDRIRILQGDLLAPLDASTEIDLLLCNPPYVPARSMDALPAEYRAEPANALAAGDDGMAVIARLLPQAALRLGVDGWLVLEVGHEADAFERRFPRLDVAWLETASGERSLALIGRDALRDGL